MAPINKPQPNSPIMDKVIPLLPCPDIKGQVAFYEHLGFRVLGVYTSPNPYAALHRGSIELHFYGNRRMVPKENSSMCFLSVEQVDAVYDAFIKGLRHHLGKIPRSGIPRISKVRDLSHDRRFTLVDPGGNTLFIGTPVDAGADHFFRSLQDEEYAKQFTVLYDVVYSKEDCLMAEKMLPKFLPAKDVLNDLDQAKLLLVELDIGKQLGRPVDDSKLKALLEAHQDNRQEWQKVKVKYYAILQDE